MINIKIFSKHTSQWIILSIDMLFVLVSVIISYFLRLNFTIPKTYLLTFVYVLPIIFVIRLISFLISKIHTGLIRYTSTKDAGKVFFTVFTGSFIFVIISLISFAHNGVYLIPVSVIAIDFFVLSFMLIGLRLFIKTLFLEYSQRSIKTENVIIYGADEFSLATKKTLDRDTKINFKIVALLDDTESDGTHKIDGVKIYNIAQFEELTEKYLISNLIIANNTTNIIKHNNLVEVCLNKNIKILTVPKLDDWINGELSYNQIRKIKIEDLLEREPIKLDEKQIIRDITNQIVLVTGAAGSIGSELVKQITKFNPKKIIAFDQAESPLYDLELELCEKYNFFNFDIVIGDVTNKVRVNRMFKVFEPKIIFHAAAYKHVPMMENNPSEAVNTNILGTKILADIAVQYHAAKFVMISTDKAVNPTNVMGASKRIAEMYTQSLNSVSQTKFITTRFGNVLGSNGSVIPRFKTQIESGGPVTVTHPEVTRYFMTIPEACQLVLQASAFGNGGEVFIFDMGKSVKIVDLAKKMIKLYGLNLGTDIQIKFSGLRPGEKLYEELLNTKENTTATHHPQIMIAKLNTEDYKILSEKIDSLISILKNQDNLEIVKIMKNIVPEFKSKNSIFEVLDN